MGGTTIPGPGPSVVGINSTVGAIVYGGDAANVITGSYTFTNITGNTWVGTGINTYENTPNYTGIAVSKVTLGGTLDGIRILASGANTFDAGTINVTYSG